MFYAAVNRAVCGYKIEAIAFESKKRRDEFVKHTDFNAVSAKEAKTMNEKLFKAICTYPESAFDENGYITGIALFTYSGDFYGFN